MKSPALEFEPVFAQHYSRVFRHAFSLCGNKADAEDITQEVFVGVMKGLSGFRGDAEITTWIYQITTRVAGRHMARQARYKPSSMERQTRDDLTEAQASHGSDAADDVSVTEFVQAMNGLSLTQRTVLSLVCIEGLSHQVVADVLGIPVGTVWSRLHGARKQLAKSVS